MAMVAMAMPAMATMAVPVPVVRRRAGGAGSHALLVASAARLIGDLCAAADIDRQVRVGPDVAKVDRARLADARRDAAVAALIACSDDRRQVPVGRPARGPMMAMMVTMLTAMRVPGRATRSRHHEAGSERRREARGAACRRIGHEVGRQERPGAHEQPSAGRCDPRRAHPAHRASIRP
jgi:hypothetical protein